MTEARVVLRLTDVVKTFPGVMALKGVGLEVVEGEVHALVGENGAGKSTLMAVAAGSTLPDTGIVEIGGLVMESPSPATAQAMELSRTEHVTLCHPVTFLQGGPGSAQARLQSVRLYCCNGQVFVVCD